MLEPLNQLIKLLDTGSADCRDLISLVKMNRLLNQVEGRILRSLDLIQLADELVQSGHSN